MVSQVKCWSLESTPLILSYYDSKVGKILGSISEDILNGISYCPNLGYIDRIT